MTSVFTQPHGRATAQPSVLVPLYIYPLEEAWQPLFDVACAMPDVLFVAIINPCSGPGTDALPDASYTTVLRKLSSVPNIRPIGYVHCSYGRRALDAIRRDIDIYHGWNHSFRLEGIFVNETPSDLSLLQYMSTIARYARVKWQNTFGRPGFVVYNPGVVVDSAYFEDPDLVVIFERSGPQWRRPDIERSINQVPLELRPKAVAIIHSLSESLVDAVRLTSEIRSLGFGGLHLTEQLGGGYTKWPVMWATVAGELGGKQR